MQVLYLGRIPKKRDGVRLQDGLGSNIIQLPPLSTSVSS